MADDDDDVDIGDAISDEEIANLGVNSTPVPLYPFVDQFPVLAVGTGRLLRHMASAQALNISLQCYPVAMIPGNERHDVDNGGKIILPPSILQHLTRFNATYPMLFRLTNKRVERSSHCGVLEFIADFNKCYVPFWMMRNLNLEPGDSVQVQSATLPVAGFAKFEPQSVEFLEITNPKAMLENAFRNFACLTVGDLIAVMYNGKMYELRILETQPGPAVSIIECDMDVDFAPPVGYVEPESPPQKVEGGTLQGLPNEYFVPFTGAGNRLDGNEAQESVQERMTMHRRGIPDYDYVPGNLQFTRNFQYFIDKKAKREQNDVAAFIPFSGTGFTLRSSKSTNI